MDKTRAKQIINSPDKIEVYYQGKPVWLESIEENSAYVTVMGTCRTMTVPLAELEEIQTH
ncbi:MAG: H-type small acid-soluble spore protein [Firmicutes bacterium]|nr:H-type small acid-soluble spore protein [Bacillota bacterium]